MYKCILWTHQGLNYPAAAEPAPPRRSVGCESGGQLRSTGMSKPEKKVRAAGKCCQGRGQIRMGHDPASPSPCPALSLGKCRCMSSHSGQIARYNQSQSQPIPQGCTCSLPASQTLSQPCCWRAVYVNDQEKQSHRAVRAHCAISVDGSFLPAHCQLAQLHPPGMALQLCNSVALQILLLALLEAAKAVTDQDKNNKAVSLT